MCSQFLHGGNGVRAGGTFVSYLYDDVGVKTLGTRAHLLGKCQIAGETLGNIERVRLIEPLEVVDFHNFINRSYLILTDSGGIQEEAPTLGKPVLVLRDTTERPEGIEAGTLKMAGTDEETIYAMTKELLSDNELYRSMSVAKNPYGDGRASIRIADAIEQYFR